MSQRAMSANAPDDPFESLVTLNRALLIQHLLRGLAHELRNHLQILTLSADGPGMAPPSGPARREQAVDAMVITLDLLTALGRMEPDPQATSDLGAVLGEVVRLSSLMRNLPDGRLDVEAVPPGLTVAMPPSTLTQVLLNLVANAKEAPAAAGAGARAGVRLRIGERRRDRIEVVIEDGGGGFVADAGLLWRTAHDRRSHGGIGYPVAAGLVARHGGALHHQAGAVHQVVVTLLLSGPY